MPKTRLLVSTRPYTLRIDTSGSNHMDPVQASKPKRPAQSVHLRRLDGSSYNGPIQIQKVEAAQDVHNGQSPPRYKSIASYANIRYWAASISSRKRESCRTCSRRVIEVEGDFGDSGPKGECSECRKKRATNVQRPQDFVVTQQTSSMPGESTMTLTNTNSLPNLHGTKIVPKKACHKCGRAKRQVATARDSRLPSGDESTSVPPPVRPVASQHIMYVDLQKTTHQSSGVPRRKPVPSQINTHEDSNKNINIDITPPTAVSEHPQPNILTGTNTDRSPLLETTTLRASPTTHRSISVSSVTSTISRSLSKRRKQSKGGVKDTSSSEPFGHNTEHGASHLINMITNAIRGNESQNYARLSGQTETDRRPDSPFSFIYKANEDSLELNNMQKVKPEGGSSGQVDVHAPQSEPPHQDSFAGTELVASSEHLRRQPDHSAKPVESLPILANDMSLANPDQPTDLFRFKSLRNDVQRAGSLARSGSLKRLNSLKNVPQLWYRTDITFEGVTVGVY